MFLRSLKITNNGDVVRDIRFGRGLNLIIDDTPAESIQESGNNVGKTTVLRLVSYCFGADADKIYADPEFPAKQDPAVKEFLESNDVVIEIRLAKDLDFDPSADLVIERNFLKRKHKKQRINGVEYRDADFARWLKRYIFNSDTEKPTIKQLVAKSIREGSLRTENAIYVLDPYSQAVEYEALFLFWLGIPVDTMSDKQRLEQGARLEKTILNRLNKEATESQIDQALRVIDRQINVLERKRDALNINPDYHEDLAHLNAVRLAMTESSARLGALQLRRQLLEDSVTELQRERSSVDVRVVEQLYREAERFIPDLQRTFAETLSFHNKMIDERIEFMRSELPAIERRAHEVRLSLDEAKRDESRLVHKLSTSDSYEMIEAINADLYEEYRKRGQYEESRKARSRTQAALDRIESQLRIINSGISDHSGLVEQRIAAFNEIFAAMSAKVYGEQFILSSSWPVDKHLSLAISTIGDNPGTGKKLGEIALFDLSYVEFADREGIDCLHFVMQDRMENVHGNQLRALSDVIKAGNCQYIVTILRDKLPGEILRAGTPVLTLSQSDKLFRLP